MVFAGEDGVAEWAPLCTDVYTTYKTIYPRWHQIAIRISQTDPDTSRVGRCPTMYRYEVQNHIKRVRPRRQHTSYYFESTI